MKRYIEYLLIVALLLPMIHDLRTVEDSVCVVVDGGQYLDEPTEEATYQAPPTSNQHGQLLRAVTLRRFSVVRVKCLRLFSQRPIIHSESARHSELRSGDVSTMRI